jgi:ribosomal protein L11 methyltransferase
LGKRWPALDITTGSAADPELILAAVDDYSPTAAEERAGTLRIFFTTSDARDRAFIALRGEFTLDAIDVDDEDWARRGQPDLSPITVGRIVVVPDHPARPTDPAHPAHPAHPAEIVIAIPPSMGFGTGHHVTTRLCLAALQSINLEGKSVLDVGTGSGLLAIAAVKLGAARAVGIDDDPDAIQAAKENLERNDAADVELFVSDLMTVPLPAADVVVANLTGAMIVRAASRLAAAVKPSGVLILSGVLAREGEEIRRAFANQTSVRNVQEARDPADEWLAFTVRFD